MSGAVQGQQGGIEIDGGAVQSASAGFWTECPQWPARDDRGDVGAVQVGVPLFTIVYEDSTIECWQQPKLRGRCRNTIHMKDGHGRRSGNATDQEWT
jgi:hypothetical protein